MKEKLKFLNNEKPYSKNNMYFHYLNSSDKILLNQNNNYLSNDIINLNNNKNIEDNIDINKLKRIENQKTNNIHIFQSINNKNRNKINLNKEENNQIQKENISLYSSLKQLEIESRLKDAEINGYKIKMKSLIKQIKEKNKNLNNTKSIILKLCDEQVSNQNSLDINNTIKLSNYKLQKYKNRNNELLYKINEQNNVISRERKKFMKLKNDYIRIKEDSKDKDNQIKS